MWGAFLVASFKMTRTWSPKTGFYDRQSSTKNTRNESSPPTPHGNWIRAFFQLIVTMIFLLRLYLKVVIRLFFLSSASSVQPTKHSERLPHRKVTGNTDQTGGIYRYLHSSFLFYSSFQCFFFRKQKHKRQLTKVFQKFVISDLISTFTDDSNTGT